MANTAIDILLRVKKVSHAITSSSSRYQFHQTESPFVRYGPAIVVRLGFHDCSNEFGINSMVRRNGVNEGSQRSGHLLGNILSCSRSRSWCRRIVDKIRKDNLPV